MPAIIALGEPPENQPGRVEITDPAELALFNLRPAAETLAKVTRLDEAHATALYRLRRLPVRGCAL